MNELMIMTCVALCFAVALAVFVVLFFKMKANRDDYIHLCVLKSRDLENYARELRSKTILQHLDKQQLKEAQDNEMINFRLAVWLYDWVWSMTYDTEKELFIGRSLTMFKQVCKEDYKKQLESIQKYHEKKIEEIEVNEDGE